MMRFRSHWWLHSAKRQRKFPPHFPTSRRFDWRKSRRRTLCWQDYSAFPGQCVSAGSGVEQIVPALASANLFGGNWSATLRGVYFLAQNPNKSLKIRFYDFASGNVTDAAENDLPENFYGGITASHDGTSFLYARREQNASSIMLAESGK